ncbi:hypothetical protein Nepgr_016490 [Nepenthes gracilis]|uniref:Uncharacterized protein n=1 Tax=Nepenthes gracilis TaxID=150966 RepID=A0AAD3SPU8_NEPGR|nr:hypothetical protein Nepgr_016490 [Nepenthes gracilis]
MVCSKSFLQGQQLVELHQLSSGQLIFHIAAVQLLSTWPPKATTAQQGLGKFPTMGQHQIIAPPLDTE